MTEFVPVATVAPTPTGSSGAAGGSVKSNINQSNAEAPLGFLAVLGGVLPAEITAPEAQLVNQNLVPELPELTADGDSLPLELPEIAGDGEVLPHSLPLSQLQLTEGQVEQAQEPVAVSLQQVLPQQEPVNPSIKTTPSRPLVVQPAAELPTAGSVSTAVGAAQLPVAESAGVITPESIRLIQTGNRNQLTEYYLQATQQQPAQSSDRLPAAELTEADAALIHIRRTATPLTPEALANASRSIDYSLTASALRRVSEPRLVSSTVSSVSHLAAATLAGPATAPVQGAVSAEGSSMLTLNTPMQQPGWGQELGEKIQWMVGQRAQGAEIKLNPAHLGPMEVKIQIHNEQASIQFTAAHGVVREALEAAIPRLREMLESNGVQLTDVDVSEHSFAQQRQGDNTEQANRSPVWSEHSASAGAEETVERWVSPVVAEGRLDLFA